MLRYVFVLLFITTYSSSSVVPPTSSSVATALSNLSNECKNPFLKTQIQDRLAECDVKVPPFNEKEFDCLIFYDINRQLCDAVPFLQAFLKQELNEDQLPEINQTLTIDKLCEDAGKWTFRDLPNFPHYRETVGTVFNNAITCVKVCGVEDVLSQDTNFFCKYYKWGFSILQKLQSQHTPTQVQADDNTKENGKGSAIKNPNLSAVQNENSVPEGAVIAPVHPDVTIKDPQSHQLNVNAVPNYILQHQNAGKKDQTNNEIENGKKSPQDNANLAPTGEQQNTNLPPISLPQQQDVKKEHTSIGEQANHQLGVNVVPQGSETETKLANQPELTSVNGPSSLASGSTKVGVSLNKKGQSTTTKIQNSGVEDNSVDLKIPIPPHGPLKGLGIPPSGAADSVAQWPVLEVGDKDKLADNRNLGSIEEGYQDADDNRLPDENDDADQEDIEDPVNMDNAGKKNINLVKSDKELETSSYNNEKGTKEEKHNLNYRIETPMSYSNEGERGLQEGNVPFLTKTYFPKLNSSTARKKYSKAKQRYAYADDDNAHFFSFFLTAIIMVVLIYVLYHNKNKVSKVFLGLLVEGRQPGRRRNSRGHAYRRLDTLEQAMSTKSTAPPSKIIY